MNTLVLAWETSQIPSKTVDIVLYYWIYWTLRKFNKFLQQRRAIAKLDVNSNDDNDTVIVDDYNDYPRHFINVSLFARKVTYNIFHLR